MRVSNISIHGDANKPLRITYPNSIAFMYSRQPIIVEAEYGASSDIESITVEVQNDLTGDVYSETRALFASRVEFDISRILQLMSDDADSLTQRLSHNAGQTMAVSFTIHISYNSAVWGPDLLHSDNITVLYGALDQGEIYGEHNQRRLWVNFPQTFNLWKNREGEVAFVLDDAYIYPDVDQDSAPCHECDLIGTMLAAGELDEFMRMLPERPQRNIGLTWLNRIELGAEQSQDLRIVTLVPDYSKRDEGTYLRWLNRRGEMSYYLFRNSQLRVSSTVEGSFSRYYPGDPATPTDGVLYNPLRAQYREAREMVIGAVGVSRDEFEDLCDLASSPIVERLLPNVPEEDTAVDVVFDGGTAGTSTKVQIDSEAGEDAEVVAGGAAPDRLKADEYVWQRVNVVAGTYARNIRRNTPNRQDFELVIELPERNTIKL